MASQQSKDAAAVNAIKVYYSKKILETMEPETLFYSNAPEFTDIPSHGGKTIEFTRYRAISALYKDNTDEFTAQKIDSTADKITATLHEMDGYTEVSRYVSLTSISGMKPHIDRVRAAAVKTVDKMVRNDIGIAVADVAAASSVNFQNLNIDGGTLNSTGATARVWTNTTYNSATSDDRFPVYHNKTRIAQSALVNSFAKTAMSVKTIMHGVNELQKKDIPPYADGLYRFFANPEVIYQIKSSTAYKGWFSPTSSEKITSKPTDVGILNGVRLMASNQAYKYTLSGDTMSTASGSLFCSLLVGKGAYTVTRIGGADMAGGFKFFIKVPDNSTVSDPTSMKRQVGFSVNGVAKVTDKSAGLWLLSTSII